MCINLCSQEWLLLVYTTFQALVKTKNHSVEYSNTCKKYSRKQTYSNNNEIWPRRFLKTTCHLRQLDAATLWCDVSLCSTLHFSLSSTAVRIISREGGKCSITRTNGNLFSLRQLLQMEEKLQVCQTSKIPQVLSSGAEGQNGVLFSAVSYDTMTKEMQALDEKCSC